VVIHLLTICWIGFGFDIVQFKDNDIYRKHIEYNQHLEWKVYCITQREERVCNSERLDADGDQKLWIIAA
jgi:hypothetical protein